MFTIRKRWRKLHLVAWAASLLLAPAAWAVTCPVAADTYVSPANPALNFGNLGTISVGPGATSANAGLIQFDLTCLAGAAQANIGKATLTVYVDKALVAGGLDFAQIESPWTESTVTYNTKPAAFAAFATNVPVAASGMYVTVDVTSVVQNWVSGARSNGGINYGIQVTAAAAAPTTSVALDSKESTTTSQPARLDITLVTTSYMSGLVGWIPSYQVCNPVVPTCQEQTLFMVNLTAGQTVTLDFYTSTSGPGSVYHAQISKQPGPSGTASDYSVIVNLAQGTGTPYQVTVSPSVPLYSTWSDPTCQANPASCPVNAVIIKLMSDSLLTLQTNSAAFPVALNEDITDSIGAIKSAQAQPTVAHTNNMTVVIWNAGDYKADFIASVSQCTTGIIPVAAQSQTLNAGQNATLNFVLYSSSPFTSLKQCTVSLWSTDGRLYDSTVVQFE